MNFDEKLKIYKYKIDNYIDSIIPENDTYIDTILNSMRYSLFAGGKRLRPVLMFGTGEIFDCDEDEILPYAAGIEMIHTYSLIHDDLPGMDDDDYRRGKPSNHKVYGVGMAILAGDALLNCAFEHMLEFACKKNDFKFTKAAFEIARASGIHGMIGGQVVDIESSGKTISNQTIEYMHKNKTGALIRSAVRCAAIISCAEKEDIDRLTDYAEKLGLAFQIIDDILDITGDEKKLGKKIGSDIAQKKPTYVSMYGIEKSKEIAKQLSYDAISNIKNYGSKAEFLYDLTEYLLNRDY